MRRLNIAHVTEYWFSTPVTLLPHRLRIRPLESHSLRIESSTLEISPANSVRWYQDVLGNSVAQVNFNEMSSSLRVLSEVIISVYEDPPLEFLLENFASNCPFDYAIDEQPDLAPFQQSVYPGDRAMLHGWLGRLGLLRRPIETFTLLLQLNCEIANNFSYQIREEEGVQSPAQTLSLNSGSCRDFAALFIEACRYMGLASRFVSGYLHMADNEAGNATTHAWAEVYLPGPGWKGFDPTSGLITGNQHIPVAVARHPEAVPPVSGSFVGPAGQRPALTVSVRVSQLGALP
ncbi:MAG: transglutaminase family protein [Propionivibrio sp.]|nr:transglutaminase family protein [Propionivibrio sp.]MBK9028384.1 transglutaminase family protein [Propionivibrio sp.]